jgi:hypothetical protein
MAAQGHKRGPWSRLAWFITLYLVSLGVFAAVIYGLRALVPR